MFGISANIYDISVTFAVEKFETVNDCKAVAGIEAMLEEVYNTGKMPSLYKPEKLVDMTNYNQFGGILA